jgi:hypothetical protein
MVSRVGYVRAPRQWNACGCDCSRIAYRIESRGARIRLDATLSSPIVGRSQVIDCHRLRLLEYSPDYLRLKLILYRPGKRGRVGDIYFCEMAVRGYMSIYVLRSTNGGEEDAIMGRTCRIKQASYLWYGYPIWWQAGLFFLP